MAARSSACPLVPCRSLAALLAILLASSTAGADDASSLRVAVWLRAEGDAELLERVRGQVADLDVELIAVHAGKPRPGRGREAARTIGRERGAQVVVWFQASAREISIYVADLAGERLLVRTVERPTAGELAGSAALETAAMIVRSSLRAIASGGTIGIQQEPPPVVTTPVVQPPPPPARASRPFATVGWIGAFTDDDSTGHHGLSAAVGLARGRARFAIEGSLGLPVDYDDAMTTIRLSRSAVAARFEAALWRGRRVDLAASLAAGAAVFSRSTADPGELMATAPARVWSPLVAPDVRLIIELGSLPMALELTAGVDVLLRVPSFGYQLGGEFVDRNQLWPAAPRVGVGVRVEGGR